MSSSEKRGKVGARRRSKVGEGTQAGIEIAVGVIGGALIGHGLDVWLGTRWVFLVVLFLLGAAAGMLNAYRLLRRFVADDPEMPDGGS